MEGTAMTDPAFDFNLTCSNTLDFHEISVNATILEEGLRLCPLCQSEIKFIFINLTLKMIVCENAECVYPLGYEEPENIFFRVDKDHLEKGMEGIRNLPDKSELFEVALAKITTRVGGSNISEKDMFSYRSQTVESMSSTCSLGSAASWSDLDTVSSNGRVKASHDITDVVKEIRENKNNKYTKLRENKIAKAKQEELRRNVNRLNKLSQQMKEFNEPKAKRCLKNEKWLKKLMQMQNMSGMTLLRPEEVKYLKKKEPDLGFKDLKINIDTNANSIPSIRVEIGSIGTDESKIY